MNFIPSLNKTEKHDVPWRKSFLFSVPNELYNFTCGYVLLVHEVEKLKYFMIHAGYEGSDHCRKKKPRVTCMYFLQCSLYIPSNPHESLRIHLIDLIISAFSNTSKNNSPILTILFCVFFSFCLGLFQRDFYVISSCVSRGIPVATVIGGGYDKDVNRLALRHTIVHRAAIKVNICVLLRFHVQEP